MPKNGYFLEKNSYRQNVGDPQTPVSLRWLLLFSYPDPELFSHIVATSKS